MSLPSDTAAGGMIMCEQDLGRVARRTSGAGDGRADVACAHERETVG